MAPHPPCVTHIHHSTAVANKSLLMSLLNDRQRFWKPWPGRPPVPRHFSPSHYLRCGLEKNNTQRNVSQHLLLRLFSRELVSARERLGLLILIQIFYFFYFRSILHRAWGSNESEPRLVVRWKCVGFFSLPAETQRKKRLNRWQRRLWRADVWINQCYWHWNYFWAWEKLE